MNSSVVIAGFGGQGVLFLGKLIAYCGLISGKEVSWLPSYGPEMRGGTANCNVCVSDEPIGSPIIANPDILIAMNRPSLEKYASAVKEGGVIVFDSSLASLSCEVKARAFGVPATGLSGKEGLDGLANMIVFGKVIKESGLFAWETIEKAMQKVVPAKKAALTEKNLQAVKIGFNL